MVPVQVLDSLGQQLSPCSYEKSQRLLASGKAILVCGDPYTIRLNQQVVRTPKPLREQPSYAGQQLLLHLCCGPCATFTSQHLKEQGWDVTGFWYNPNIEPQVEYQNRLQSLKRFTEIVSLPMVWDISSDSKIFQDAVRGNERFGQRCAICYRLRLRRTAQVAAERGIDTISTSLLISPYQNLELLREIGTQEAAAYKLQFYFENMRSGYAVRTRLSHEYDLYLQTYCGCGFSAQEAEERRAQRAAAV